MGGILLVGTKGKKFDSEAVVLLNSCADYERPTNSPSIHRRKCVCEGIVTIISAIIIFRYFIVMVRQHNAFGGSWELLL